MIATSYWILARRCVVSQVNGPGAIPMRFCKLPAACVVLTLVAAAQDLAPPPPLGFCEQVLSDMQALYAEGRKVDWMYEPTYRPRWYPGFPERLMFATLTCAPWSWVLVAPCEQAPLGFINVQTGQAHPVVW